MRGRILGIEKTNKFQIVVYGTWQREVDRAGAFIQGKYDEEMHMVVSIVCALVMIPYPYVYATV